MPCLVVQTSEVRLQRKDGQDKHTMPPSERLRGATGEGGPEAPVLLETFYFSGSESWQFILLLCFTIFTFVS